MVTAEQVRKMYEDVNGPTDLSAEVLEKSAKYGNVCGYEEGDEALLTALDIFRLQESGEFVEDSVRSFVRLKGVDLTNLGDPDEMMKVIDILS